MPSLSFVFAATPESTRGVGGGGRLCGFVWYQMNSSCGESHYNHATGEFVVVPGEELKFSHFPLSPREALELLRILNPSKITTHTRN
jgi:hypothetical protein